MKMSIAGMRSSYSTFRDLGSNTRWQIFEPKTLGSQVPVQNFLRPPATTGRRLVRPVPFSVSRSLSGISNGHRLNNTDGTSAQPRRSEVVPFLVRGEIVYATPALEKTRRVPTTFNIGHRWPELDTDHLLRHGLPPAVQQKVIYLSRRIASHFPRCRHDEQDLIQDFTLEVVKAMIKFDWAKGKPVAFMRGVLDNAYMDKLRRLNNPSWYPAGLQQFDHHEHGLTACTGRHNDHTHEFMIAEDFQAAIYKLPPERKHLVELLQHTSTPKAAERLGIHRGTAYAWRTKLQEEFGDKLRDFL